MSENWRVLRRLMAAKGLNPKALSLAAGLNETAVRDILRGRSRSPRFETLQALALVLGCPVADLAPGIGDASPETAPRAEAFPPPQADGFAVPPRAESFSVPPRAAMPLDVPVLGVAEGGADGAFELNGTVIDRVRRPPGIGHARNVYAIFVTGTSMSPRFEPGELIYVHPDKPPQPGADVVIQLAPREAGGVPRCFVKRLVRRGAEVVRVAQFNPPCEIDFPAAEIKALHRVLTAAELLGI